MDEGDAGFIRGAHVILGRDGTCLYIHELQSLLRSPEDILKSLIRPH